MIKTEVVWHDGKPDKNGEYIVHSCWGRTESMMFANGKWNTHIDSNGIHCDKSALDDDYVVLWAEYPKPPQMGRSTYKQWMNGTYRPTLQAVIQVLDALGLELCIRRKQDAEQDMR